MCVWYVVIGIAVAAGGSAAAATWDLGTGKLVLDDSGIVTAVEFADGARWPSAGQPAFSLDVNGQTRPAQSVQQSGQTLTVRFDGGITAEFRVETGRGFAVLRLTRFEPKQDVTRLRLFSLGVPDGAQIAGSVNAAVADGNLAAVLAVEPNVQPQAGQTGALRSDRSGCSHSFVSVADAKAGRSAARFTATCNEQPDGWSMRGRLLPKPLNLTGCQALRAWVHGDGKGEHLKIQLYDGRGGYRDYYVAIDFQGWRPVTITTPALDNLRPDQVTHLHFYYNGLPAKQTVSCLIDQVEALVKQDGAERNVLLEDFEDAAGPLWAAPVTTLRAETARAHGVQPAACGVLVCRAEEVAAVMERFETAAGLPCPRPGGVWNKTSPWIKRSYFFLTDFRESQFDEALAIAQRGGFHTILLGQESWSHGTGHYEINRDRFPDGLDGLKRTFQRFKDAGFRVGLHFLGPSVYPPDPYLTPVPDPRLVHGPATALADGVDDSATFLPTAEAPAEFPAEDGGYEGAGTVLQVGSELIWYGQRSLAAPFGFKECRRGHLGTKRAAHEKGAPVTHLVRAYGYHMFDMDTSLLDEVAANFARVGNACGIDMIYFDGSERLQGDHWYYNARLHKAFYDKLQNKDMLLQASSYSHFSWHILARSASADGHGDLKGYLDERSGWFTSFHRDWMPLDIGWYYGYDPTATPDMFEYILGATIGYDSSMSFQVSPAAAARHPFTGEILDMIRRYEQLRLSGRVPEEMRARLRIDAALAGEKKPEERARLLDRRREYRLLGPAGQECFQRVVYGPWHAVRALEQTDDGQGVGRPGRSQGGAAAPSSNQREVTADDRTANVGTLTVLDGAARIGVQIQAQAGPWLAAGPAYHAADALLIESFDDLAPYTPDPKHRRDVTTILPGEAGSVSPGVSQRLELSDRAVKEGRRCAIYTAESTQADLGGWSAIGRAFDPPLDLSWHKGIGFWLRGDGHRGSFKLQLCGPTGAMDYYITNDFVGWRYQQLPRPAKDPIDYRQVRTLTLYYNGLPAKTTVACGIDDVKALRSLDEPSLTDPFVEVGGQRWTWRGTLTAGQFVLFWPGEAVTRYGLPLREPERLTETAPAVKLPAGEHPIRFGCRGPAGLPVRVRMTLQPPERYAIPR